MENIACVFSTYDEFKQTVDRMVTTTTHEFLRFMGRLGFRVGVSASYSYFRRVRNFDFVYTAAVSLPLAYNKHSDQSRITHGYPG